ncbi:Plexin-A4 [Penaeus vannamei]|uniref:Plexin-A4 n=1 Tax=Penaeus vannamei TaxID=6689 RepID=A0A3R7QT60_PENVA|nr:Plexin-A4 [Penaeus vannamei]
MYLSFIPSTCHATSRPVLAPPPPKPGGNSLQSTLRQQSSEGALSSHVVGTPADACSMSTGSLVLGVTPPGGPGGSSVPLVRWRGLLLLAALVQTATSSAAGCDDAEGPNSRFIVERFEEDRWQEFTHLTVDKNTGTVYAGGVNRLYQLEPNLRLLQYVVTGPVSDSVECPASGCFSEDLQSMKPTNNVNKVLVIDYTHSRLIVCGSVGQGSCQVRDLRDITQLTRNVSEAIVANNATASTVAFIAPGPPNPPVTHVLYIGVTYTGKSVYRDEVPAVASRSLEDNRFFDIAVTDVTTSTRMLVNSLARKRYPITYVYGFGSENFSYFLTRQMEDTDAGSPYMSKLVRVCQNDPAYYSYTEIPIECKDQQGKHYNLAQAAYVGKPGADLAKQLGIQTNDDVLFAVFSPSESSEREGSPRPADSSALCVYSMKSVRRMFIDNIQKCFRGKSDRGLNFISPSHHCIKLRIRNLNEDFCGMDVNTPLGGEQPVESLASLTFPTRLTAVAATSTEVYTVVFLGTAQGHLKKVVIENQNNALEYDDIEVDQGSAVRQDMHFDKAGDHLYVMTSNKISKVKTKECSIYEGCSQCLGARDPYCGWCSSENKCSLRRDCREAFQDPRSWLDYKTGRCAITRVKPDKIQRTTRRTLALMIENMPPVDGPLQCVFSSMGKDLSTETRRTAEGVSCATPRTALLPDIPQNKNHFTAKLCVRRLDGVKLVCTNFTFFDCTTYSSCTECVSSPFPCDWCVDGHRCTHDSAENCRNDVLVNGVNRIGPSIRSGPSFCPRITFLESQEILVSSGSQKSIKVKVDNIAQFIVQTRYVCQFNIEGRVTSVSANLLSDTIYCDRMEFSYTTAAPSINATFAVIWGGSKPLDNPGNIHVLVYKCQHMANNCGMCLNLAERFRCGWCQSSSRCEVAAQCEEGAWLDRDRTCPNIMITNFYPRSGPWDGGTNVTIEGINLGKQIDDIYDGIYVAGIPCQPIRDSYVPTRKVTCLVDSPGVNSFKEGPIVVKVSREYRSESEAKFRFVNPEITAISPDSGPRSGGTVLHIIGKYMNAGSRINAFINGLPCTIQSTNASTATCITSSYSDLPKEDSIEMTFDNGRRKLEGKYFTYVDDSEMFVWSGGVAEAGVVQTAITKGPNLRFIVGRFEDDQWQEFTHLTVDKKTGMVYAGGVNRLYKLDPNLRRLQYVVTGPVKDSVQCSASVCFGDTILNMKTTNNVNKVLVIDYYRSRLIVCGTVRQGSCQVCKLQDITQLTRNVSEAIVANSATASTVAFIARGVPNPFRPHVLYVGVTYTGNSVHRDEVPAVASRSLEDERFLDVAIHYPRTSTRMWVNSLVRKQYLITYVYGFSSEKFSYFLTRQMEDTNPKSPYISKLVRVCQNDQDYYSYTEIPIECKDSQGKHYNLAQAAFLGKPGTDLATQMGIQPNDDVLFAVFSCGREDSPRPANSNALCVYSMKSIRRRFIDNIQECYRGKGERGLNFISPSQHCIEMNIDVNEDFCGTAVNTPLGGKQPVESLASLTFPTRLTAVAATSTDAYTVVFLGTAQGHLKKVVIENQTNALEYDDIEVDQGSAVRQDMHFDKAGDHLYVMTSNKISKVKTRECSIYEGRNQCLGARDPYCGWCSSENKCSSRRDCREAFQDPRRG